MSIFDPTEKGLKEIEVLAELSQKAGVTIVESDAPNVVATSIEDLAQQGRPVYRWDAKTFKKYDAEGSMYQLSKLPKEPKPIVIIENIADIPDGDLNVYDDPEHIENILLHSWKNDTIHLTYKDVSFQMNKWDYTVIFPIKPEDVNKLHHRIADGFKVVTL